MLLHPYRMAAPESIDRQRASRWDDRVLGAVMIAFGGLRVALAVAAGEAWGAEVTIAMIMTALGAVLAVVPSPA